MNTKEVAGYNYLSTLTPCININSIPEGYTGTLLYGFTHERDTVHVYSDGEDFNVIYYNHLNQLNSHIKSKKLYYSDLRVKRAYAQESHYFFMSKLREIGFEISLTYSGMRDIDPDWTIGYGEYLDRAGVMDCGEIVFKGDFND